MDRRAAAVADLERALGYVFENRALLDRALTHASVDQGLRPLGDYERLEFLGDRVLALIIAEVLMAGDEAATVGALSKRLHVLVSREACAAAARSVGIGPALRLPGGETRRGARDQTRILADACEAVIAALYQEAGMERTRALVLNLWEPLLREPIDERQANPKSQLQEWAAANGRAPPEYRVVSRTGPDHAPSFIIEVTVDGAPPAQASAGSRQAAEKAAALALLLEQEARA